MPVSKRPRSIPLTKTDLTEALDRVITVFDTKLTETRLQLERKIDWGRQDAKEHLEAVDRRLSAKIDAVDQRLTGVDQRLTGRMDALDQRVTSLDQRLTGQIAAVYGAVKEVRELLTVQGQTVEAHDRILATLHSPS